VAGFLGFRFFALAISSRQPPGLPFGAVALFVFEVAMEIGCQQKIWWLIDGDPWCGVTLQSAQAAQIFRF
jgi:hypothetical protein